MFLHVWVGVGAFVTPRIFALDDPAAVAYAFRADHALTNPVRRARNLPTSADGPHIAGVEELNSEMVEDVAVLRACAVLPASQAVYLLGKRVECPVDYVDVVYVLLTYMVARKPPDKQPVTDLPFHVRPLAALVVVPVGLGAVNPKRPHVPVALGRNNLTDCAVVYPLHRLDVLRLVSALRAGNNGQALLRRLIRGLDDHLYPCRADGHGFLHKDVFAASDGLGKLHRPKAGRRPQDDQIHIIQSHQLLVRVKPDEAAAVADLVFVLQTSKAVLKSVGQCDDSHARRRLDTVTRRAGASTTTANHADTDSVAAPRFRQWNSRSTQHQGTGRYCRTLQEFSSC